MQSSTFLEQNAVVKRETWDNRRAHALAEATRHDFIRATRAQIRQRSKRIQRSGRRTIEFSCLSRDHFETNRDRIWKEG
jgi:hypothetical protein